MTPGMVVLLLALAVVGAVVVTTAYANWPQLFQYWRSSDAAQGQRVRDVLADCDIKRWEEEEQK